MTVGRSRQPKAPPKERAVYEGPVGLCPYCDEPTEVRLGSTLGQPISAGWVVPADVLGRIYKAIADRVKEKGGKLYVTDPSEYDATRRSKLFFVDGDDGIAGPFGRLGLKVFLGSHFGQDHTDNIYVYIVATTPRALSLIRLSPFASESEDAGDLDGPADLF